MDDVSKLIKDYLKQGSIMQVATVRQNTPWICTVSYVPDENQNLYWLSLPTRRHSEEIAVNPAIAVAIAVKTEQPVIGIQAEGKVQHVTDLQIVADIMPAYVERFNKGKDFYDNFIAGKNQHWLYKFTPEKFALFDAANLQDGNARIWKLGEDT